MSDNHCIEKIENNFFVKNLRKLVKSSIQMLVEILPQKSCTIFIKSKNRSLWFLISIFWSIVLTSLALKCCLEATRGPAESWRDLFDYFNLDYFKIVLKFQVSQVDSTLPTQKKLN